MLTRSSLLATALILPGSTVTVAGSTVEIDLVGPDDGCEYNGHAFAGTLTLAFAYDESTTKVVDEPSDVGPVP